MRSPFLVALGFVGVIFTTVFPPALLVVGAFVVINLMSKRSARRAHARRAAEAQEFARDEMRRAGARSLMR